MFWTPFAQPQQFSNVWAQAMKDHLARVEAWQKEMVRLEEQNYVRANEAIEESARLAKESLAYAQKLQAEWRKISLDAMKQAAEPFSVGA
jgi:hypothetical protein